MIIKNDSNFPEHFPILYAQRFFLQKAVELKPEIINDLHALASISYSNFFMSLQLNQVTFKNEFIQMPVVKPPKWAELAPNSNAEKLRQALLTWVSHWNLNANWCLDYGLRLLYQIYDSQISRFVFGEQHLSPSHRKQSNREMFFRETIENKVALGFLEMMLEKHGKLPSQPQGWPEWNPIREKRQAYIHRVGKEILRAIEANHYLSAISKSRKRGLINSVVNIADQYCDEMEEHMK